MHCAAFRLQAQSCAMFAGTARQRARSSGSRPGPPGKRVRQAPAAQALGVQLAVLNPSAGEAPTYQQLSDCAGLTRAWMHPSSSSWTSLQEQVC